MKKLFLTSVAALLLAIGPARADDESDAVLQERCKNGAIYWCTVLQDRLAGTERPPPEPPKAKQKTVLHSDSGGNISIYFERFKALGASGDDVEIRGKCLSACTLITVFIPRERLCFGETAWSVSIRRCCLMVQFLRELHKLRKVSLRWSWQRGQQWLSSLDGCHQHNISSLYLINQCFQSHPLSFHSYHQQNMIDRMSGDLRSKLLLIFLGVAPVPLPSLVHAESNFPVQL
jgi:hypothetical protein